MECENIIKNLNKKGIKLIPPKDLPKDDLIFLFLEVLTDEKIIGLNVLRDIKIRTLYGKLKQEGKTSNEARQIIIEQQHTDRNGNRYYLGEDTVRNILYAKNRRH